MSGGFFVFDQRVERYLDSDASVLEREPFERLAREGQLKAYLHDGFWQCMDTYREQQLLHRMWTERRAPWKLW